VRALAFAYHEMGCVGLEALLAARCEVVGVVTHPDARGEEVWFRSVSALAREHGIPVWEAEDSRQPGLAEALAATRPEFAFSFYFRKMLPAPLLALAPRGALNLHGSLLPRYRGRCPINWVLVHGEVETGVTLHYMDEKPDHGDIVGQVAVAIERDDTALTLYRKVAAAARRLLDDLLPRLAAGTAPRIPQDHSLSTYFGGRRPDDGKIDWSLPAERIRNLVRAVTRPWPGAFCSLADVRMSIWSGETLPGGAAAAAAVAGPGTLVARGGALAVATGDGLFLPGSVELPGRPESPWAQVVRERELVPGMRLAGDEAARDRTGPGTGTGTRREGERSR
jgi:UDP-4-amino-4-deoxy-L-arabinose formyltransferase/UDP-glucuronic acid dehydrogenase (UDP-4-keto-hexauronic acid decarboxylating)